MENFIKVLIVIFFSFSFFIFGWISHSKYNPKTKIKKISVLDKIKKDKTLNVVLLNAPAVYYIGTEGATGFEYDLLSDYAKHLGVELNITVATTIKEAIKLSENQNIHITSSAIAKTKARVKKFNFGPSYFEVQEQVICNRKMLKTNKFPRDVDDLYGLNIVIGESTSYSETISNLQKDGYDINVTLTSQYSTDELLEQVATNKIDCTIADSNIFTLSQRYYTEIIKAFTISSREQLAWVLTKDSSELESDMYLWLNSYQQNGSMVKLKDHYYDRLFHFDYYNITMFNKRIKTRLSKYENIFKESAEYYGIPWMLLAAVSYQESYWNPKAKSVTGVRGLMMLTLPTAKLLGVTDRLDPKQSIVGGTRHLKQMIKFVPKSVLGENRLKFALAAYNVGLGHIYDAQTLAIRQGLDENEWSDLKKVLPLLAYKKYYKTLKYGYARGIEPVKYVDAIYNFRDILEKKLNIDEKVNAIKN